MTPASDVPLMDNQEHVDPTNHKGEGLLRRTCSFLQMTSSVLLRLFVYIFLRWIPSGLLVWPVHFLYSLYLFCWILQKNDVQKRIRSSITSIQIANASEDLQDLSRKVSAEADLETDQSPDEHSEDLFDEKAPLENKAENREVANIAQGENRLSGKSFAKAVILGRASNNSMANRLALFLHTVLFLFFLDSVWSPYLYPSHLEHNLHFARVGAIGPKSATIHVRYPFPLGGQEEAPTGLIEEDTEFGSFGGALKDLHALREETQPIRVVYREAYEASILSSITGPGKQRVQHSGAKSTSVDGRPRMGPKRWEKGPLLTLTAETDWTATAKLDGLWPATTYEWRLAFAHNSTFTPTPSRARQLVTWPDPRLSGGKSTVDIRTDSGEDDEEAPLDDPNHFSFVSSSCIRPDFPWVPTQFWAWSWILRLFRIGDDHGGFSVRNRIQGFDTFAASALDHRDRPAHRFFLQLGDVIYADVPYYGGPFIWTYRKLYRNLFGSESFRRVYERLPVIGIYDDHEVINNWGGKKLIAPHSEYNFDTREPEALQPASQAWQEYIGNSNPESLDAQENYYTFRYGDSAFFVLDTRKHRSPFQLEDNEDKTMLGTEQRDALVRWLGAVNSTATFKFVVSSVPFNTLWGGPLDFDGKKDTWSAYRTEREYLLGIMEYIPNIVVLSGDRHEFAAVGLAPRHARKGYHPITEFSTSPFNMFYLPVRTLHQSHGLGPQGAEQLLKYIPDGNIKWTEFRVDTRDAKQPRLHVKVVVDGHIAWKVEVLGMPIQQTRNAVGDLAKSFLELLHWRPRRWFL